MKRHLKRELRLADLITTVAQFARNDHEVGVVVADLINRGIVRVQYGPRRRLRHGN